MISRGGTVAQYRLDDDDADGQVGAARVRLWDLGSEAEGCVADDDQGLLYIAEEDVALWRYGAEPSDGVGPADRVMVDQTTADGGRLAADIEGIALVHQPDGGGYLIVSAQAGSETGNYYAVYERGGDNAYVRSFQVVDGSQTDRCGRTDGVEATASSLGPSFPFGLFICQDNLNTEPGGAGNQNFKFVPLERVVPVGQPGPQPPIGGAWRSGVRWLDVLVRWVGVDSILMVRSCRSVGIWAMAARPRRPRLVSHEYAAEGIYTVTLTVTDDTGQTDTAQTDGHRRRGCAVSDRVPCREPSTRELDHARRAGPRGRAARRPAAAVRHRQPHRRVHHPRRCRLADSRRTRSTGRCRRRCGSRPPTPVTPQPPSTVRTTASTKLDAQLLAYAGTDPADPVAQSAVEVELGTSADHTTPTLQVSQPTWVVSYWADKTSSSNGWVVDPTLQERAQSVGTGGGRITSLTADTGGPVGPGTVGGHTAQSTSGNKATMWTICARAERRVATTAAPNHRWRCLAIRCAMGWSVRSMGLGRLILMV